MFNNSHTVTSFWTNKLSFLLVLTDTVGSPVGNMDRCSAVSTGLAPVTTSNNTRAHTTSRTSDLIWWRAKVNLSVFKAESHFIFCQVMS